MAGAWGALALVAGLTAVACVAQRGGSSEDRIVSQAVQLFNSGRPGQPLFRLQRVLPTPRSVSGMAAAPASGRPYGRSTRAAAVDGRLFLPRGVREVSSRPGGQRASPRSGASPRQGLVCVLPRSALAGKAWSPQGLRNPSLLFPPTASRWQVAGRERLAFFL